MKTVSDPFPTRFRPVSDPDPFPTLFPGWGTATPAAWSAKSGWNVIDNTGLGGVTFDGQDANTRVGDLLAYSATGYYASAMDGSIVGPANLGAVEAAPGVTGIVLLGHELNGPPTTAGLAMVTGTPVTTAMEAAPSVTPIFGTIWDTKVSGFIPASATAVAANAVVQEVRIRIRVATSSGGALGPLLCQQDEDEPIELKDEISGSVVIGKLVPAGAAMPFSMAGTSSPTNYKTGLPDSTNNLALAGDINGNVIGPLGSSGQTSAALAWTIASGTFASSATAPPVTAQSYAAILGASKLNAYGTTNGTVPENGSITLVPTNVYIAVPAAIGPALSVTVPIIQYNAYMNRRLGSVTAIYTQSALIYGPPPSAPPLNLFPNAMFGPLRVPGITMTNHGQRLSGGPLLPQSGPGSQQYFFQVGDLNSDKVTINAL